ncbi:MAG: metalloprotease TldD [Proteobacteria bacterium]|nr:metalloprotease TldD [Pseudomonadota bacterium]
MIKPPKADEFFFTHAGLEKARIQSVIDDALGGLDDGELYFQYGLSEVFSFDNGHLKTAAFDTTQGFGLRGVVGEVTGYAHSNELTEEAIKRAAETITAIKSGEGGRMDVSPRKTNRHLYPPDNPLEDYEFQAKVKLLEEIDAYLRAKDERVRQVSASLAGAWNLIHIMRAGGASASDIRPLVRLNISVVLEQDGRMETGVSGTGGRHGYSRLFKTKNWKAQADEALRQATVNMTSVPAPAGEMQVVLGPGWPGVLLHEAVGHGLEGDFNRKKTSAFAGLMGQQVAARGITVVDDGTLEGRRGSLTIDDEGTPTSETVLIEDGILKGYIQDRQNARLMGMKPTGNGRRESYAHAPMPRMTNTFMLAGKYPPEEILKSVKEGIYATSFGGGQVDITNGKFVFSCTEAYRVKDGKVGEALKGATLIGSGPEVLKKVTMVGNDLELDLGIGTCGKEGQSIPVGVGQPTLLVDGLTVGGTGA